MLVENVAEEEYVTHL